MDYLLPKKIVANWKMNGTSLMLHEIESIYNGLNASFSSQNSCIMCLPASLIFRASSFLNLSRKIKKNFFLGGQDCHFEEKGPYTGDISAEMIKDSGADYIILGHSERRVAHRETSEKIAKKAELAFINQLTPIICVGETEEQRESGNTFDLLEEQIFHSIPFDYLEKTNVSSFMVAYEPIWAIGSGKIPKIEEILEVHHYIYNRLKQKMGDSVTNIHLLYGGSVKKENAQEILKTPHVDGVLVGGASLFSKDFLPICNCLL